MTAMRWLSAPSDPTIPYNIIYRIIYLKTVDDVVPVVVMTLKHCYTIMTKTTIIIVL